MQPARIGFHTLHLLRLLDRLPMDTGQIITLYDNVLGTIALSDARRFSTGSKRCHPDLVRSPCCAGNWQRLCLPPGTATAVSCPAVVTP